MISGVFKLIAVAVFSIALLFLIAANLAYSNVVGETCGFIHPAIFQIEVSMQRENGTSIASTETSIPAAVANQYINPDAAELYPDVIFEAGDEVTTGNTLDTYLRVYDANGTLIVENDDVTSGVLESFIQGLDLTAFDQPLFIEVGTFSDSGRGQFLLEIFEGTTGVLEPSVDSPNTQPSQEIAGTVAVGDFVSDLITPGQRLLYELTGQSETGVIDISLVGLETVSAEATQTTRRREQIESAVDQREPPGFNFNVNTEDEWASCLQYYGYVTGDDFTITQNGIARFVAFTDGDAMLRLVESNFGRAITIADETSNARGLALADVENGVRGFTDSTREIGVLGDVIVGISPISKQFVSACGAEIKENGIQVTAPGLEDASCNINGEITLSVAGRMIFYVFLPLIVILLPVLTVLGLTRNKDRLFWSWLLILVVVHSTTTSLLFITLSQVSGIDALQDFGTGIFGGIVTGAALGFVSIVVENFAGEEKP